MEDNNEKYFGSFPISKELYDKVNGYLEYIKENIEQQEARIKLNEIVNDLTTEGVDYFFHYSLKIIGMNIIAKKAIGTGLAGVKITVKSLSKRFVKRFDEKQLLAAVDFIEGFITRR